MLRKVLVVLCLGFIATAWAGAEAPVPVKIMTQNMDAGTDLSFVIGAGVPVGVALTYQEILVSAIPQRAAMLAEKVATEKPDLLALQEATLWRTGTSPATATTVLADQLQLLRDALAADGVPYDIVAVNTVFDIALPMDVAGNAFRMTDRDALLVRADLRPPAFHLSDVHTNLFDAVYAFGDLRIPAGWISAMVHLGNRHFRLLTTHLQSPVPGDPTSVATQVAQATQLLREVRNSTVPVVLTGDFNSDALDGGGPDGTPTADMIQAAGYADTWKVAGSGAGPTWPVYLEDQYPPPFVVPFRPGAFERIDLVFSQGLLPVSVKHVISPATPSDTYPFCASDHEGVIVVFQF